MPNKFLERFEEIDLPLHGVRLPEIIVSDEDYKRFGVKREDGNLEFLRAICRKGYAERLAEGQIDKSRKKEYGEQMKRELELVDELGYTDYILLVWDVINFCGKKGIPVGPGRGSAPSSLILYLSRSTDINPIKYGLFFERFISRARSKSKIVDGITYIDGGLAPDVDLDICYERRQEVVDYLEEKYGGKFCKLPTLSTLQSKILVKECGKIIKGYSEDRMKEVSDSIPTLFGKVFELEKAEKESERFKNFCDDEPDIFAVACKLRGLIKNKGSHASAYLVSYSPLEDFMPCELSAQDEVVCAPDMQYAQIECIKLDLLGLKSLTLVDKVCKYVGIDGKKIDIDDYDSIYAHVQDVKTPYGLFQISGDCNVRVTQEIKPKTMEDLAAVVAIARPGALACVTDYANDVSDQIEDPKIQEILKNSKGCLIYQETLMSLAHEIFGFPKVEGENLRKVVGKKLKDKVKEWQQKIYTAGEERGVPQETIDWFWNSVNASADYLFNRSHSFSYATLSALTIYLKFNYPQHFFIECLRMAQSKQDTLDEVGIIHEEMREFGMLLLPPDLLKSEMDFSIEDGNIRFGLFAIKGIADKSIGNLEDFISVKTANKFQIFQAGREAKLNIGVMSALIQAGALSSSGDNRPLMVLEAQLWGLLTAREKLFCLKTGSDWGFNLLEMVKNIGSWVDEKGKPVARKTRFETIKRNYDKYKQIYLANRAHPRFAAYVYEKKLLGYSYSESLKSIFKSTISPDLMSVAEIKQEEEDVNVECVIELMEVKQSSSAKGQYMKMVGSDETGTYQFMFWDYKMKQYLQSNPKPKEGSFVWIKGKAGKDIVWVDRMQIQDSKIYMKLAEMKGEATKDENLIESAAE